MGSTPSISNFFLALAPYAEIAVQLCDAISNERWTGSRELRFICTASGIPLSQQSLVEKVLQAGSKAGFCQQLSPMTWDAPEDKSSITTLTEMLRGVAIYRQHVHCDSDLVEVVLTRPPKPSRIEQALQASGYSYFGLEGTGETFDDMASRAKRRFVVMSPFLDKQGAATLLSLFMRVSTGVRKELVIRYKDSHSPPDGLDDIQEQLTVLGVATYNYRLDREDGWYETFHAKVVLVDDNWCYVGSANMTKASLEYSMELGVAVRGKAASRVSNLVDAIIQVAKRIS